MSPTAALCLLLALEVGASTFAFHTLTPLIRIGCPSFSPNVFRKSAVVIPRQTARMQLSGRAREGFNDEEASIVRRAALDVGSACIKLVVADVRVAHGKAPEIINTVFEAQDNVYMTEDLQKHGGTEFSKEILEQSFQALKRLRAQAEEGGATEIGGVATAAFRKASNGPDYLLKLRGEGIRLQIVPQDQEAALGFMTASAACPDIAAEHLIAWDSGGGSFQVSCLHEGKVCSWMRPVGSGVVTTTLLAQQEKVRGANVGDSVNPVGVEGVEALVEWVRREVEEAPAWVRDKIRDPASSLVGIGDAYSIFHVACHLASESAGEARVSFRPEEVWAGLERVCIKNDAELLAEGYTRAVERARSVIPKLVLLYTVMDLLGCQQVLKRQANGNAMGVLLTRSLWQ